jgi:hypothetical protein
MSPEERAEVPKEPTAPEEIAELVVRLVGDDGLVGRVFVWWTGEEPEPMPVQERPNN